MNGEQFYLIFKEVLKSFNVDWSDKDQVSIYSINGGLMFFIQEPEISYTIEIRIPKNLQIKRINHEAEKKSEPKASD